MEDIIGQKSYVDFKAADVDPNNDLTWLLDVLEIYLKSAEWTSEICDFIDDNCIQFAGDLMEENSLEATDLHNRFRKIVDLKLDLFCAEYGIS